MRVTVALDDLKPALDAVAHIVKSQTPLPIWQHVLLTAEGDARQQHAIMPMDSKKAGLATPAEPEREAVAV